MKSDQYWIERMEALLGRELNKAEDFTIELKREYRKAKASIEHDIEVFYARFAKNNEMSLGEARQALKGKELEEFHWTVEEYIAKGKENAVDQAWMKEMLNASIRVRVSRLDALLVQMRQHVEVLTAKKLEGTEKLLTEVYEDQYYRSIYEVQKGVGVGSTFSKLETKQVERLIQKPWANDGSNFSERIWKERTKLVNELQTTLTQGLIRGDAPRKMAQQISERMDVSMTAASRLVQTESAFFAGQARKDSYKEMDVEQYKYMATLDRKTSKICSEMDGKVFDLAEAMPGVNYPPLHVYCRSTTIPHFDDNLVERVARGDGGESYDVPGKMTYSEWKKVSGVDKSA